LLLRPFRWCFSPYPTAVSKPVSVPASYPAHHQMEFEMELLIGFVTTLFISLLIFRT
jgi:hypothetical protein